MADFVKLLLNPNDKNFQGPMNYSPIPEQQEAQYTPIPTQKAPLDEAKRMLANWDAAMATRNAGEYMEPSNQKLPSIDVSALKYTAPQVQELESARNELQEAQELDRQSGSEGYEAKPDGIFDRLKGFGAAIIGKQGLQEWQDFKKDFKDRGIGAVTQRANSLMEDMARSPFSKFVDPTTVLGGQRTMVNDIDSYFNQQGLPALRSELLAQDIARLKTPIGQAEEWAKKTPEQQAAMATYPGLQKAAGYTGVGPKNWTQVAIQMAKDLEVQLGRKPTMDELDEASMLEYGVPYLEMAHFGDKQPQLKNAADFGRQKVLENIQSGLSYPEAVAKYREDYGDYETPSDILLNSRTSGTYAPDTKEEKLSYDEEKKAQDLDLADFSDLKKEVNKNAEGAAMNAQYGRSLNGLLDEAAANNVHVTGGGDLGKALRRFGANYGLVDPTTKKIVADAAVLSEAIFGNQIANIIANQNRGNITERERDLFARQAINLGASEEETRLRLDLYVLYNELAINRARKLESLSNLRPLEQYRQFKAWRNEQYDKTASLVKAVVDSHLGTGSFDKRERDYNGGI